MKRLENEKSTYLSLRSGDLVDWYPWGREAFDRAAADGKPILLSIGYAGSRLCRLMGVESFRDSETAELINSRYVPVIVDREARPELDSIYMGLCKKLNGGGSWPLTVIMTDAAQPFFVGGYLPRDNSEESMGLKSLLTLIAKKWDSQRQDLIDAAEGISALLHDNESKSEKNATAEAACAQLYDSFDADYGGFGCGAKFPLAPNLLFLTAYAKLCGDKKARRMVDISLRQMYRGGIYDHIGGGFFRYSTDREWLAPCFEKTLCDNAMLALLYTEAWQEGHMAMYRDVAEATLDFCLRELKNDDGGFSSALFHPGAEPDGDPWLFTEDEVLRVLGEKGKDFCQCYDISAEGNFHGRCIPNLLLNDRWALLPEGYDSLRESLRLYRNERFVMERDAIISSSTNAIMLMALSRAARVFGDRRYLSEAKELADFMKARLFEGERLMSGLYGGELRHPARLHDCTYCALALLELYCADYEPGHICDALTLAGEILHSFPDEKGGFFCTACDTPDLPHRQKDVFDEALPSANGAAALLFGRLYRLSGDGKWQTEYLRQYAYMTAKAGDYPAGICTSLEAALLCGDSARELVFVLPDEKRPELLTTVAKRYAPDICILLKTPDNAELLEQAAPYTKELCCVDGKASCYVCAGGKVLQKLPL